MEPWEIDGLRPQLRITSDLQSRAIMHKDSSLDRNVINLMKMNTNTKTNITQSSSSLDDMPGCHVCSASLNLQFQSNPACAMAVESPLARQIPALSVLRSE
jgi:hypothetical protein